MFRLELDYGRANPGFLGVYVVITTFPEKAIAFTNNTTQRFKLFGDGEKLLTEKKDARKNSRSPWIKSGDPDPGWGYSKFYKPKKNDFSKQTKWKILIEFEYEKEVAPLLSSTSAVQTDWLKLLESPSNADLTFVVQGESIKAHKDILSVRSQYFERMFATDVEENVNDEVKVPDVEPEVFRGLMHFLYSGLAPEIAADKALDLLLVADKYGEDNLVTICEEKASASINVDNVVDTLLVAESVNSEKLMTRAKVELMASDVDAEKLKSRPALLLQLLSHCAKH